MCVCQVSVFSDTTCLACGGVVSMVYVRTNECVCKCVCVCVCVCVCERERERERELEREREIGD